MKNKGFRIIFFLTHKSKCCHFPATPDEIIKEECSLNVIDYNGEIVTDAKNDPFTIQTFEYKNYKDANGLLNHVAAVVSNGDDRTIFSVHPNATLITLYRWALLKNIGYEPSASVLHMLQRRCVDICESFYRPTVLSLERRNNFSCKDIQTWLGPSYDEEKPPEINCFDTIKNICLKL